MPHFAEQAERIVHENKIGEDFNVSRYNQVATTLAVAECVNSISALLPSHVRNIAAFMNEVDTQLVVYFFRHLKAKHAVPLAKHELFDATVEDVMDIIDRHDDYWQPYY